MTRLLLTQRFMTRASDICADIGRRRPMIRRTTNSACSALPFGLSAVKVHNRYSSVVSGRYTVARHSRSRTLNSASTGICNSRLYRLGEAPMCSAFSIVGAKQ